MKPLNRREMIWVGTFGLCARSITYLQAAELPQFKKEERQVVVRKGREFLAGLLDPELDLLPEYRGARVYWLYHDNYLAAKILDKSHPQIASSIRKAIEREGVSRSGKIELLFGELKDPLPFRQFELTDVRRAGDKVIRTEVVLTKPLAGWENYADLLLMASIAEKDASVAKNHFKLAMNLWDGNGFNDAATKQLQRYSTYKLALGLIAARKWKLDEPGGALELLLARQSESGGWITDYNSQGQNIGLANVETTCLSILGIETLYE